MNLYEPKTFLMKIKRNNVTSNKMNESLMSANGCGYG